MADQGAMSGSKAEGEGVGGASPARKRGRWRKPVLALAMGLLACVVLLEVAAQGVYLYLDRTLWSEAEKNGQHFYRKSDSKELGYELVPDWNKSFRGRYLITNSHAIRDRDDDLAPNKWKVVLLGDSIVFGNSVSQEKILSERLQRELDPSKVNTRVLNFGVSGYSLGQIMEFLREKDAIYHANQIVYILNPNDFCVPGTVTEGSDGSLYRMYVEPTFKTPWLLRKGVYRLMHGQTAHGSDAWHRWIFKRNGDRWKKQLEWLKGYADEHGQGLLVAPLPAGSAYHDGGYALSDINDEVLGFLRERGIESVDLVPLMQARAGELFDKTNHCTEEGNELLVKVLSQSLGEARRRAIERGLGE